MGLDRGRSPKRQGCGLRERGDGMTEATTASIKADEIYPLSVFRKVTGIGRHGMRSMRNRGLVVRYVANKGFVHGADFIEFMSQHAKTSKR